MIELRIIKTRHFGVGHGGCAKFYKHSKVNSYFMRKSSINEDVSRTVYQAFKMLFYKISEVHTHKMSNFC